jgi:ferredoxin
MSRLEGKWNVRRFQAMGMIVLGFWRRRVRKLVLGRADDGGATRWLENFAGEGFAPLHPEDTEVLIGLSRCTACGLCEASCPEQPAVTPDRWPAYARALELAPHAVAALPVQCPPGCGACEAACPAGVPLAAVPALLQRRVASRGQRDLVDSKTPSR